MCACVTHSCITQLPNCSTHCTHTARVHLLRASVRACVRAADVKNHWARVYVRTRACTRARGREMHELRVHARLACKFAASPYAAAGSSSRPANFPNLELNLSSLGKTRTLSLISQLREYGNRFAMLFKYSWYHPYSIL